MKKIIILALLAFVMASCSGNEEIIEEIQENSVASTKDDYGVRLGKEIIRLALLCEDMKLSDETAALLKKNPDNLEYIAYAVTELSQQQPYFGDTVEECDVWELWCDYFEKD